jgi:hypothetical protein
VKKTGHDVEFTNCGDFDQENDIIDIIDIIDKNDLMA